MANKTNQRSGINIFNILAIMLLLVALLTIAFFGALFFMPDLIASTPLSAFMQSEDVEEQPTDPMPTTAAIALIPTLTPTPTPRILIPTWTPDVGQPTITLAPTNTRSPTLTPSLTPIFPTKTPTPTRTPTPTNTPTETPVGPTPTSSPTRSAFIFTKSDNSPFYLQNYANTAGCKWLGLAGEVLDLNRTPVSLAAFRVHVWGSGLDLYAIVGGAPAYSPSGWEQFVSDTPGVWDYNVQLETVSGTAVSQVYTVQTRASCNQNLLRLDFIQNH